MVFYIIGAIFENKFLELKIIKNMSNCHNLFKEFDRELTIIPSKKDKMMTSRDNLRERIKNYFKEKHPGYIPKFYIQGSYKLGTTIRTKDDKCDLDDGVYFRENPDGVSGKTLQDWIVYAVNGTTDATPLHKRKCIRVDYKAGYNIDIPVMLFNKDTDMHPRLAVKDSDFKQKDKKEFVDYYKKRKTEQMNRMVKYLKAWCDNRRENMPSGIAMTVLVLKYFNPNDRDDIALKFLLIEIERALKNDFKCVLPTTPKDNLFDGYSESREKDFKDNLSKFIADARSAISETNQLKASKLWKKHLGDRFPLGNDEDEDNNNLNSIASIAGTSKPYCK